MVFKEIGHGLTAGGFFVAAKPSGGSEIAGGRVSGGGKDSHGTGNIGALDEDITEGERRKRVA